MGHHRLPARVRRRHPALRAHRRPLQPAPHVRGWPRRPRRRLAVLRAGPHPSLARRWPHRAGGWRLGDTGPGVRGGGEGAAARRAGHGARAALCERRSRGCDRTRLRRPGRGVFGMARVVLVDGGPVPGPHPRRAARPARCLEGWRGAGLALFGVTEGQVHGFQSPVTWGSFALSALLAVFFVWRTRTAPVPFVSPALFRNRAFLATAAVGFFMMFANLGSFVIAPLLLSA